MKKIQIMGILNFTPDSFFDGGKYFSLEKAVEKGIALYHEGADWIDIGGESTRPFSKEISIEEELARVIPVIKELKKVVPIPLSIDTKKFQVAQAALEAGATLINDISGFEQEEMITVAKNYKVPICVMHMLGTPSTMQIKPYYEKGVIQELLFFFDKKINYLLKQGILSSAIILDPGIGFGKTIEDNARIIRELPTLKELGFPILIGLSRKSFMSKILNKPTSELLSTTVALNTMSILLGADIIRVHDVKEHHDVVKVLEVVRS